MYNKVEKKRMGDVRNMSFEEYYDNFLRGQGHNQRSQREVRLSKKEYDQLKANAEKYEALVEEHKKVRTRNDELLKQMDDMKQDARKLKDLMEENEKYLNSLLRVRADFENYQKRTERENERYKEVVMERIMIKLINHYDDLVRALNLLRVSENLEGIRKGFEIIVNNFRKVLEGEGVSLMDVEGEHFDPYKHEVVMVEEDREDLPENTIIEELEKGYYYKNKILRPAKVKISKQSRLQNLNENIIQN
jgi:molecular chaperone GrpE